MDTFDVIRLHDPRLATVPYAQLKKWVSSRDAADLPEFPIDAPAPAVFHCRRLSRSHVMQYVVPQPTEPEQYLRAFLLGCVGVSGLPEARHQPRFEPDLARDKSVIMWSDDEIDEIGLAPADLLDIGHVILFKSMLPKDCAPLYRVLPMSAVAWDGNAARYAARTPRTAPPNNEPPKEP